MEETLNKSGQVRKTRVTPPTPTRRKFTEKELKQFWNYKIHPILGYAITTPKIYKRKYL